MGTAGNHAQNPFELRVLLLGCLLRRRISGAKTSHQEVAVSHSRILSIDSEILPLQNLQILTEVSLTMHHSEASQNSPYAQRHISGRLNQVHALELSSQ